MIEAKIPKCVFEIGDKFLGDYGHEHTIIGYPIRLKEAEENKL
jgi:hypothetical protein